MSDRHLADIMITDIVRYTALMGKYEDRAFEVLHKNGEIHTKFIKQFNGTMIKEMGDGMLTQFPSAANAVQCTIGIQKMAKRKNRWLNPDRNPSW
jgi:class 3 adenylate cyclase